MVKEEGELGLCRGESRKADGRSRPIARLHTVAPEASQRCPASRTEVQQKGEERVDVDTRYGCRSREERRGAWMRFL
jgi:hypothetical protein